MNNFTIPQDILDKVPTYSNKSEAMFFVEDGGIVVGEEIDQDNRLIYIIRKETTLFASYAEETTVISNEEYLKKQTTNAPITQKI